MNFDPIQIISLLTEHRVRFVLIGGYAAAVHGVSQVTLDMDICCSFDSDNLMALQKALKPLHPVHRMISDERPLELTRESCASLKNLYLKTDAGVLDCLGAVKGVGSYEDVESASEARGSSFGEFRVLTLDALIEAKQAMNRPKDRETVLQLQALKEKRNS